MASLTTTGYVLTTQNEWFAQERQFYLDIDPLWNLDPSTPDGLKMAHDAEIFYSLDETLMQAYNSKDPNKAVGADLDIICAITGSKRSPGSKSSVALTISGTPGSIIQAGTTYESSSQGTRWTQGQTFTLDSAGAASVNATCTVIGPTEADAGTIDRIVTVVAGLSTVTNPSPATPGTDAQTDSELRVTRAASVGRPGSNQIDSLIGNIYAVNGVRRVKVYENSTPLDTVSPDNPYGLPAHSFAAIVDGGTDYDVALAIYLKKNPGVRMARPGTPVTVLITSPVYPTNQQNIRFSRPFYVDAVVALTVKNDGTLPSTISDELKAAIIDFGEGDLIPAGIGFKTTGFDIGEIVPYSSIFTPINKVLGAYGNSYVVTLTLNGGTTNLAIAYNQLSRWLTSNITVIVT